jgi:hypothetical protein
VGICNQITLIILYYISSRLVNLLEVIDVHIQAPDIFYLTISFKFLNFSFQIFLLLLPEMSTSFTSRLSTLLWLGSFNYCFVACSNSSKNCLLNHYFFPHLVHEHSEQWYYTSDLSERYMISYC